MRLDRILTTVFSQPWAILPTTHAAISRLLQNHLAGGALPQMADATADEPPFVIVGNTAVINIQGIILNKCSNLETLCGAFSLEAFRKNLRLSDSNPAVTNIILNISSGGGTITGVPETADLIADIATRKDIYAYSNDVIASAAYWLACQAKAVFLSKSATAGSIGVYLALLDVTRAMDMAGERLELFKAGEFKAMGIDGKPLTDGERALLQASVEKAYTEFTGYVTAKRKVVTDVMQGQLFDADDCVANGLADGIINELDELVSYLNKRK